MDMPLDIDLAIDVTKLEHWRYSGVRVKVKLTLSLDVFALLEGLLLQMAYIFTRHHSIG
jgi:hypothetical protein